MSAPRRFVSLALAGVAGALFALHGAASAAEGDPCMGDWAGTLQSAAGEKSIAAQVIALGKGAYRLNLLPAFDQPGPILLQNHGNPVQYRNIWVVPLPAEK